MFPETSNANSCVLEYQILVTDNQVPSINTLNVSTTNSLIFFELLLRENNKSLFKSNRIEILSGDSISTNITVNTTLSEVVYNLNLTCKEIDISKVKLKFLNERVINFGLYFSSTLYVEYEGDPNFFIKLEPDSNDKSGSISPTPPITNMYIVFWSPDIFTKNGFGVIDDLILRVDFGKNRYLNASGRSYFSKFSIDKLPSLPFEINFYPPNINQNVVFNLFSPSLAPIVEIKIKSDSFIAVEMIKSLMTTATAAPIKGTKGEMTYSVALLTLGNGLPEQCTMFQQDNFFIKNSSVLISYLDKSIPSIPSSVLLSINNFTQLTLNLFSTNFSYNGYKSSNLQYLYNRNGISSSWPFGFVYGNNLNYSNSIVLTRNLFSNLPSLLKVRTSAQPSVGLSALVPTTSSPNSEVPKIKSYNYKRISSKDYLFIVRITSTNGVKSIWLGRTNYNGLEPLVNGNIYDGIYEFIVDIFSYTLILVVTDLYGNEKTFSVGDLISLDPLVILEYPTSSTYKLSLEAIDNLSFLFNDINMTDGSDVYNVVTLNSSLIPIDSSLAFSLVDHVSYHISGLLNYHPFKYYPDKKVFKCSFIIPKNAEFGDLTFSIAFNNGFSIFSSGFSSQLTVNNSYFDNQGPIISDILQIGSGINIVNSGLVGWRVNITDDKNGFKYGIFKVVGAIDSSTYLFNITLKDAHSGDKFSSQYDLLINVTSPCITQSYSMVSVQLYDTNDILTSFHSTTPSTHQISSPFIKVYKFGESILNLSYTCAINITDPSPPILLSFSSSKSSVDVGSTDRSIDFKFNISQSDRGMKKDQLPIIYLVSETLGTIECASQLVNANSSVGVDLEYSCTTELPIGFGYPGNILFSIYGFVNNGGYYFGFITKDLIDKGFDSFTSTTLSMLPIISSTFKYFSNDNELTIIGRCLNGTSSIVFDDSIKIVSLPPHAILGSSVVKIIITPTSNPFKIKIISGSLISNIYTVYPVYFYIPTPPVPTEIPTETPTMSISPQICPGNPICGGKNGYCSSNGLCICNSPWVGSSCTSQVIIVPQPSTNTSDPSTEIPTNPIDGSSENGISNIFFRSLISLVSLREIDYNSNQVANHIFDKWIYTPLSESKNQYITSVNQGTTNITATLEWFNKTTTIEFANSRLIMNPSSIKYTIQVSKYNFGSELNELELIMSALFESSKTNDICSSNEFGIISSDDHISDDNYLKIQIENKSLFGRFIKRGLIDDKPRTISNKLLDASFNNVHSSPSSVQSFVAINIPHFSKSAIIDPDFSILIDSNQASSSSQNSICTSSSRLSKGQLAGIIVGCVAFAVSVVIIIIYLIRKNNQQKEFIKNINLKLQKNKVT